VLGKTGTGPRVRLAVVTQSPRETSLALLTRLGLLDRFDEVATDADKPEALARLVPAWAGSLPPGRILAVGDHYANDLAPAWSAGWHTIHVNPWNVAAGPVEVTVRRLEEAYPAIRRFIHGGESAGPP
jgi:FMN phosphatase YigB (HAD superfamily)